MSTDRTISSYGHGSEVKKKLLIRKGQSTKFLFFTLSFLFFNIF
jgi:hypothetical protein